MIRFGNRVRDIVTGFEGIVTARVEFINGIVNYLVSPPVAEDGDMREDMWVSACRIEYIDEGVDIFKSVFEKPNVS